jgi:hypothetical protein
MGYLRACLSGVALASFAACGGGDSKPDALIIVPDAPPDAKPIDAPPDALQYDFSCAGGTLPTTAPATITAAGAALSISQNGADPVPMAAIQIFKRGTTAAVVNTTSDAAGAWMSGNITTGGVPFDGFIHSSKATFRSTYVFPPQALAASVPTVPVLMTTSMLFNLISGAVANPPQNDTANGALLIAVTDCANTPVVDATVVVKQGGNTVGQVFDLTAVSPMAAGTYFVFNVPDGPTQVSATRMGMTFLEHTVIAFKKTTAVGSTDLEGATTSTIVRPGPL